MQAKVFISRDLPQNGISALEQAGLKIDVYPGELPPSRTELLKRVKGCDALLTLLSERVDDELLTAAGPQLKVIANFAVGYDNIDLVACSKRGIAVSNTPGVLTEATADHAMMLLLATARRVLEGDRLVRQGQWRGWAPLQLLGVEVSGQTLGIIGMGRIGYALAKRAKAFGMTVLYHNRSRRLKAETELSVRYVDNLHNLLSQSDFVSLHTPLTPETHHLIGQAELAVMKKSSVLINTARGPIIDEQALVEALKTATIWAAGLDVFEREPSLSAGLAELSNVTLAPHTGSATRQTREAMARLCATAIIAALKGEAAPNILNSEVFSS